MEKLHVRFARGSAWRACYLYWRGQQFAHVGFDPGRFVGGPALFFWLKGCAPRRYRLPHVSFKDNPSTLRAKVWQAQERFWHRFDGRLRGVNER